MTQKKLWSMLFKASLRQTVFVLILFGILLLGIFIVKRIQKPRSQDLQILLKRPGLRQANDSPIYQVRLYSKNASLTIYEDNNYSFIWTSDEGVIQPYTHAFIDRLKTAYYDGLNPEDYHLAEILSIIKNMDSSHIQSIDINTALFDILLTDAFIAYSSHLYAGRVHSDYLNTNWSKHINNINPRDSLRAIQNGANIESMLDAFVCPHPEYTRLKTALYNYYKTETPECTALDRNQIITNMERWRWMPRQMPEYYIMANIAEFSLVIRNHDRDTLGMKVIVGKRNLPTPLFQANLSYLILNPWWDIPSSIATEEMLPEIRKDSTYLGRNHIRTFNLQKEEINAAQIDWDTVTKHPFNYKLRQTPGPWNALGTIKFIFPNRYDVYFHDTPNPELFDKDIRTFSHGCIRIEKPLDLASYLLQKDTGWLKSKLADSQTTVLKIPLPPDVFICYWSTRTDENNQVLFYEDIYGYDEMLYRLMNKEEPPEKDLIALQLPAH